MRVEIDESKFGQRNDNVGSVIEVQWLFGSFNRESKEIFMVPVEKRDGDSKW